MQGAALTACSPLPGGLSLAVDLEELERVPQVGSEWTGVGVEYAIETISIDGELPLERAIQA